MINFLDIDYLKSGNEKQKKAHQVLTAHAVLDKLAKYNPILVGTIPINIDIVNSDLDIICYIQDKENFRNDLLHLFHCEKDLLISENPKFDSLKATFFTDDFEIEIFGQNMPTKNQNAYRHMLIEHEILVRKGEDFRQKIVELKNEGYKTEPAFAKLLGLKGNPYEELLKLER